MDATTKGNGSVINDMAMVYTLGLLAADMKGSTNLINVTEMANSHMRIAQNMKDNSFKIIAKVKAASFGRMALSTKVNFFKIRCLAKEDASGPQQAMNTMDNGLMVRKTAMEPWYTVIKVYTKANGQMINETAKAR